MRSILPTLSSFALIATVIAGYVLAQSEEKKVVTVPATPKARGEFEFEIIECFDSRYLGDTPGYVGRHGELGDDRPQASLGDPIFRGEKLVGHVSALTWSRGHGSLEIEFDPEPNTRICVGEVVHLRLGDQK